MPRAMKCYIVHVDMDAFFASIEQRDNSLLRGKPVIVGADPKKGGGRGVVSTCSYEARKFGIHSAMPISIAYKRCPQGVFLPVDMAKYEAVSEEIFKILYDFTPQIERAGIDEAFLDISGSYHLFGTPLGTCLLMKSRIKKETNLTASIGLAPTKMAAKIASDLKKPDGMVEVIKDKLLDFLWPLDVSKIWGLGEKSKSALNNIGINTIGDLAKKDIRDLVRLFGKGGASFWQLANGIDERIVETESETKSISSEITFEEDTLDKDKTDGALVLLSEKVSGRMRQDGLKGRTITLKIRLEGFHTFTRSFTLGEPTNFVSSIYKEAKVLYNNFETNGKRVRLLGVKISNLSRKDAERTLFSTNSKNEREESVQTAIDKIKKKFGSDSIHLATGKAPKT